MAKPFRRLQTSDRDLNLLQDHLKETLDSILACPLLDAQRLSAVSLASGTNTVGHGLGRRYVSWGWLRPSAAATLYEVPSPDPTKFIAIVASAPLVVDLLVF